MSCTVRTSLDPKPVITGWGGTGCPVYHELLSEMRFIACCWCAIITEDNRVLRGILTDDPNSHIALKISQPKRILCKIVGIDDPPPTMDCLRDLSLWGVESKGPAMAAVAFKIVLGPMKRDVLTGNTSPLLME